MRLNVDLKSDIYEELSAHAHAQGRSLSDVVRVLVSEWCEARRGVAAQRKDIEWTRPSRPPVEPVEQVEARIR